MRRGFRLALTIGEKYAPDAEESLPELHRRRKAETGNARPETRREAAQLARCPVHPATRPELVPDAVAEADAHASA